MKWTAREVADLLAMRDRGAIGTEMAHRFGRTSHAVCVKLGKLDNPTVRMGQKEWTSAEKVQLVHLKEVMGLGWTEIGRRLNRPSGTVYSKYFYIKNFASARAGDGSDKANIPEQTVSEWRSRRALSPSSLTAHFCGDPLPGYSALDRRA